MDYRILGPLEVYEEGRALALGGIKERALLAVLLLHPGEVVSLDRLIDDLWGEHPPAGAVNTVQSYVSRLRKALHAHGSPVLVTRRPGYLLQLEPGELDAHRFARAVEAGREALAQGEFEVASNELRRALDLWRGPALADLAYEAFAQADIARLEELRLAALEDALEADLALGRHVDVVAELKNLAAAHPLRERVQAQLMIALYRCGRQAEALDAYREARRLLVEDLGTEPGRELQRVHDLVLRQDSSLELWTPTANNLPIQTTSFIGREWELDEVQKLLLGTRLLTVTGVGGSGKTRLAIEVGREVSLDYPDGVWLAELGALTDEKVVAQSVASAIGIRPQPETPSGEGLVAALRRRNMLLVLDNCEHLIDACARLVATLLGSCPELRVLATSREPLEVAGETVWHLPPLAFPDDDSLPAEEVSRFESVRLFVERAAAGSPDVQLSTDDAPFVARICRRLDGMPLAIELAATRVRLLAPSEIDEHLDDRFRLLSQGSRTAPARQQTLRATVDWSFGLLTPQEAALFERLSVFAGGFTFDAAEAICSGAGVDREQVLELLGRLVDKSLVVRERPTRYGLLETLREYGAEKLAAGGELEAIRRSHAGFFLELAERAEPELSGPDQIRWIRRLGEDLDNFRAALTWALQSDEVETTQRLGAALLRDWDMRGTAVEGLAWMERALAKGEGAPDRVRGKSLLSAAVLAESVGALERATDYAQQALSLYGDLDDRFGKARATHLLGSVAHYRGDYHAAVELLESSLAVYRELDEDWYTGLALHRLSMVVRLQGDYERALRLEEQGLEIFRRKGDVARCAYALWMLGVVERYRGNYEAAAARCEESIRLFQELDDKLGLAHVFSTLGDAARLKEDFGRAQSLYEKGLIEFERQGDKRCVASTLWNLGVIAHRGADQARAKALYAESLEIRLEVGDKAGIADCLDGLGLAEGAEGRAVEAARLLGSAASLREAIGAVLPAAERAVHEEDLASVRAALGDEDFSRAWALGRAMTPEQAAAIALGPRARPAD
ncbi:MAG: BTAD domain-containing putative transcriptional regulator [Actinomycetota bacterium]